MTLGQKVARIQLSRHLITTSNKIRTVVREPAAGGGLYACAGGLTFKNLKKLQTDL